MRSGEIWAMLRVRQVIVRNRMGIPLTTTVHAREIDPVLGVEDKLLPRGLLEERQRAQCVTDPEVTEGPYCTMFCTVPMTSNTNVFQGSLVNLFDPTCSKAVRE